MQVRGLPRHILSDPPLSRHGSRRSRPPTKPRCGRTRCGAGSRRGPTGSPPIRRPARSAPAAPASIAGRSGPSRARAGRIASAQGHGPASWCRRSSGSGTTTRCGAAPSSGRFSEPRALPSPTPRWAASSPSSSGHADRVVAATAASVVQPESGMLAAPSRWSEQRGTQSIRVRLPSAIGPDLYEKPRKSAS